MNGKVDRRTLPLPEVHHTKQDSGSGALTDLEQQIEQIWRHVLKLDYIRKDEDFHALGGHSLHALRMVSMLQKEWASSYGKSNLTGTND
ncbi:phosphopantetheine-binding protein [Paenibacillus rhizoplanae]